MLNPRETFLDVLFDEFAIEQSTPLEMPSSYSSTHGLSNSSHNIAISNHSIRDILSTSQHSLHSTHQFSQLLVLTQQEIEELQKFSLKMTKIYDIFQSVHSLSESKGRYGANLSVVSSSVVNNNSNNNLPYHQLELAKCYADIPPVFFLPVFSLTNPEHFQQALLTYEKYRPSQQPATSGPVPAPNNHFVPIEDTKLTSYLDRLELTLLTQIHNKSARFFHTLDNLKDLSHNVTQILTQIHYLRHMMTAIQSSHCDGVANIVKLQKKHENVMKLSVKITALQSYLMVYNQLVYALEAEEDYLQCLEYIQTLHKLYTKELRGVEVVEHMASGLDGIEKMISEVVSAQFCHFATTPWEDLTVATTQDPSDIPNGQASKAVDYLLELELLSQDIQTNLTSVSTTSSLQKRDNFYKLCQVMLQAKMFSKALETYQLRLLDSHKLIIRTCIMEYLQGFDPELLAFLEEDILHPSTSTSHANNPNNNSSTQGVAYVQRIKEMSTDSFLSCVTMCYEHLRISLSNARQFHQHFVLYLTSECVLDSDTAGQGLGGKAMRHQVSLEEEYDLPSLSTTFSSAKNTVEGTGEECGEDTEDQPSEKKPLLTSEELQRYLSLSSACLLQSVEIIQKTLLQFFSLRKENTAKFPLIKMQQYWQQTLSFAAFLEEMLTVPASASTTSSKSSAPSAYLLRQGLLSHTRLFLDHFHELQKSKLVNCLDHERWIACDIPRTKQVEITDFLAGKTYHRNTSPSIATSDTESSKEHRKESTTVSCVLIDQKEFKIVWSVLLLQDMFTDYLSLFTYFPTSLVVDVVQKITELCKLFHLRTKQLILGAQAIQSAARLKSISAKHLAMTAQSLHFLVTILPYLRAFILSLTSSSSSMNPSSTVTVLLVEFDRVYQDLQDHHSALLLKFVHMISEMMEFNHKKLVSMQWDMLSTPPAPSSSSSSSSSTISNGGATGCEYLEELAKNITTLHKVLLNILPADQIHDVFSRILGLIGRKLPQYFENIMPSTSLGKQRIVDEVAHMIVALSRLKHLSEEEIEQVFVPLEEWFRHRYLHSLNNQTISNNQNHNNPNIGEVATEQNNNNNINNNSSDDHVISNNSSNPIIPNT